MTHVPRRAAATAGILVLALVAACTGSRARPGPPELALELPVGNVITSPDTFAVGVVARDDNRLDSVIVTFLGERREVFAFNEVEVADYVFFVMPPGHVVGEVVEVEAIARDLLGGRTIRTGTLTIVSADSVGS